MNVTQTFEQNIKELSSTQKKGIENCKKTLHNAIKELNKTMDKYKEGLKTVRSSVDEKLSVGIDGVAKQRKSLLKQGDDIWLLNQQQLKQMDTNRVTWNIKVNTQEY